MALRECGVGVAVLRFSFCFCGLVLQVVFVVDFCLVDFGCAG